MSDPNHHKPVVFECGHAEAHRDGERIMLEFHSALEHSKIRMVWSLNAREALQLAHQMETAFHQETRDQYRP